MREMEMQRQQQQQQQQFLTQQQQQQMQQAQVSFHHPFPMVNSDQNIRVGEWGEECGY